MGDSTRDIVAAIESLKNSMGGSRGGTSAGQPVSISVSNEELEEFNNSLLIQQDNIARMKEELAGLEQGSQEYLQLQKELTQQANEYNKAVKDSTRELRKQKKAQDDLKNSMKEGVDAIVGISSRMNDVQSYARELERTGGASKELSRLSIRLGDDLRLSGVSYEEVTQATKALVATATDFTMIDQDMQKSLIKDASLFKEVGVSNERYAKNMQIGMKNMGLSANRSAAAMREIRKTALALEVPINDLMEDFGGAEEKLSQLGDTGVTSFKEMARIQKITGLEMGKLISMTDKFDTFEGAAKSAGSLNAALGGNFVDSMELMMTDDPAERFKLIRNAIDSAGLSVDTMTRKQKMFMSSAAGFESVSDFTKAMSGDLSALQEDVAEAETGDTIQSLEDSAKYIRSQTELAANAAKAMEPAYGILATKAMEVTDRVAPAMFAAAEKLNEAQKYLAAATPAWAAASLGSAEGVDMLLQKIKDFFKGFKGAMLIAITMPGRVKKAITATWKVLGKTKTKIVDAFGWFSGKGKYAGKLSFFEKIHFKGLQIAETFGKVKGRVGGAMSSVISKVKGVGSAIAKGPGKIAGFLGKIPGVGKVITRVLGSGVTAVASVGNMIFESFKGVKKSMSTAGSDIVDQFLAGFGGLGKGAAEAIDYLTFGLVDKVSSMTNSLGIGFNEAWELLDFAFIGETFTYMFDEAIKSVKDLLGISSPSKVMMDIGTNMLMGLIDPIKGGANMMLEAATALIDAFLKPWSTIGTLILETIQPAIDMMPDWLKNPLMGDTAEVAGNLKTATVDPNAIISGRAGMELEDPRAAQGNGQAQVINISLTLDGQEIDKKVINLLGGIAKEAVL